MVCSWLINPDLVGDTGYAGVGCQNAAGLLGVAVLGASKLLADSLDSKIRARNIEILERGVPFSRALGARHMAICPTCQQPITESVLKRRILIAQVHSRPHAPPTIGRYLTVFSFKCGCGEPIERRYENRRLMAVGS